MMHLVSELLAVPFPPDPQNPVPHPVLSGVADWLQAVGALPALYFIVSYGIIRPTQKRFVPWWKDRVGTMIFMLSLALFSIGVVVSLSLFLGTGYPARDIVRVVGYSLYAVAALYLVVVYELEAHQASPGKWTQRWESRTGELHEFEDKRKNKTP